MSGPNHNQADRRRHTHREGEPCSVNCPANATDGPHIRKARGEVAS